MFLHLSGIALAVIVSARYAGASITIIHKQFRTTIFAFYVMDDTSSYEPRHTTRHYTCLGFRRSWYRDLLAWAPARTLARCPVVSCPCVPGALESAKGS